MKKVLLLFMVLAVSVGLAQAQMRTVSGVVTDAETGSPLPLANVHLLVPTAAIYINPTTQASHDLQNGKIWNLFSLGRRIETRNRKGKEPQDHLCMRSFLPHSSPPP